MHGRNLLSPTDQLLQVELPVLKCLIFAEVDAGLHIRSHATQLHMNISHIQAVQCKTHKSKTFGVSSQQQTVAGTPRGYHGGNNIPELKSVGLLMVPLL